MINPLSQIIVAIERAVMLSTLQIAQRRPDPDSNPRDELRASIRENLKRT